MAAWPELDELKQVLNITSDDWDGDDLGSGGIGDMTRLSRALAAAIAYIKLRVGDWDEDLDEPDDMLAHAALRAAVLFSERPEENEGAPPITNDPVINRLLYGHRRTFGVA